MPSKQHNWLQWGWGGWGQPGVTLLIGLSVCQQLSTVPLQTDLKHTNTLALPVLGCWLISRGWQGDGVMEGWMVWGWLYAQSDALVLSLRGSERRYTHIHSRSLSHTQTQWKACRAAAVRVHPYWPALVSLFLVSASLTSTECTTLRNQQFPYQSFSNAVGRSRGGAGNMHFILFFCQLE